MALLDAQTDKVATDNIVTGVAATIVLYDGPIMLNEGKLGSADTATVELLDDVSPKKFVKLRLIVYDALVKFCARMVIGFETWFTELYVLR